MTSAKHIGALAILLAALPACAPGGSSEITAAPAELMNSTDWFDNYNAGNADGVAALYAEDGVIMAPGSPAVVGRDAIRDFIAADIEGAKAAGLRDVGDPVTEGSASGNMAWTSGTFSIQDASGATVSKGKYSTVYELRNGKWLIVRDVWNADEMPDAKYAAQLAAVNALVEAWNSHDADALDAIASPDYTRRAPDQNADSLEEQKALMNRVFAAYPDFAISNDGASAGPGGAYVQWTVTGTNTGPGAQPPTGNAIKITGISRCEFENGKIVHELVEFDSRTLLAQLGEKEMPHTSD